MWYQEPKFISALSCVLSVIYIQLCQYMCNILFTPFDAKMVNERLFVFKNVYTKFLCEFFFKTLTLLLKLPFSLSCNCNMCILYFRLHLHTNTVYTKFIIYNFSVYSKTMPFTGQAICAMHASTIFSSLDFFLLTLTYSKTSLKRYNLPTIQQSNTIYNSI